MQLKGAKLMEHAPKTLKVCEPKILSCQETRKLEAHVTYEYILFTYVYFTYFVYLCSTVHIL